MNSKVGRRMLDTSLPYLKERDQGSAALLEGCLFFFFLSPLPLNMKNPSEVSEKLSSQDKSRPWAHHLSLFLLSQSPVQSRAMVTSLFFFL